MVCRAARKAVVTKELQTFKVGNLISPKSFSTSAMLPYPSLESTYGYIWKIKVLF